MTPEIPAKLEEGFGPLGPGSLLGPYQILGLLGAGAMGRIYKAFDARLGREVAIKVAEEQFSERFDREVRAIAALNHPNICTVYEVEEHERQPVIVMELLEGESLEKRIERRGKIDEATTWSLIRQTAAGLAHAATISPLVLSQYGFSSRPWMPRPRSSSFHRAT
jgi:serine/threonine protein kinase